MQAWTDYPITALGDVAGEPAPVRECNIISYDGDRYCVVEVKATLSCDPPHVIEIKAGYLYQDTHNFQPINVSSLPRS